MGKGIWDKVLKNRQSKTCGRQPLKNFIWSILEYFVSYKGMLCPLLFKMLWAIWHHLYNFKNMKNTHGEVLLLVKFRKNEVHFLLTQLH